MKELKMPDPPSLRYAGFGVDLCPVCGEEVCITGKDKDGRLIGSCGDAFTEAEWNDNAKDEEA